MKYVVLINQLIHYFMFGKKKEERKFKERHGYERKKASEIKRDIEDAIGGGGSHAARRIVRKGRNNSRIWDMVKIMIEPVNNRYWRSITYCNDTDTVNNILDELSILGLELFTEEYNASPDDVDNYVTMYCFI